jgi:hypothetical protein
MITKEKHAYRMLFLRDHEDAASDLTGNSQGAWAVDEDLEPNFIRARNGE